jgi:hypothetical protein
MVTPQPLLVAGEMAAMCAAMPAMSASAWALVTPGFSRPMTWR